MSSPRLVFLPTGLPQLQHHHTITVKNTKHHSQGRQILNPMSGGVRADVLRKRETDESACRKWVGRPVSTPWHSFQKQSAAPGTNARGKGHKGEKEIPASDDGDAVPEGCGYHIYTVIPPNGFVEVEDGLGQVIRSLSPAVRPPLYRYSAHIPCRMHIGTYRHGYVPDCVSKHALAHHVWCDSVLT